MFRETGEGPAFRVGHRHWRLPLLSTVDRRCTVWVSSLTGDKKKKEEKVNDIYQSEEESNSERNNNIVVYNF